jgi:hypothetical protein
VTLREQPEPRWRGQQTRVTDAEGRFVRFDPGPVPAGWEERLEAVLARRRARPRLNTDTRPAAVRAMDPSPTWVPDDPEAAAALNRARVAALRDVVERTQEVREAERLAARTRRALVEAEVRAADLTDPPPPLADLAEVAPDQLPAWLACWTASGPALAAARERAGLSQRELARLASYSRSYVSELETDVPRYEGDYARRNAGRKALAARRYLALIVARHTYPTSGAAAGPPEAEA